MKSKKYKVFVTGITGKIGRKLLPVLQAKNCEIYGLVRDIKKVDITGVNLIKADINEREKYQKFVEKCDYVFHLAAYQNIFDWKYKKFDLVNVQGTKNILKSVEKNKIKRFFYISTIMVLENKESKSNYVVSKLRATNIVKKSKIPWSIIYPRAVIDKHQKVGGLVGWLTNGIPGGLMQRLGKKDRQFRFGFIEEIVDSLANMIGKRQYKKEYILGSEKMSADEYLKMMHQIRGKKYLPWRIPTLN